MSIDLSNHSPAMSNHSPAMSNHSPAVWFRGALMAAVAAAAMTVQAQSPAPRLQSRNLTHIGMFAAPTGIHAGGQANMGFEYGGTAISFNAAHNSLYMVGHDWDQFVGEIGVPALGGVATLLQAPVDATEGRLGLVNPGDPNAKKIGGTLPWGNTLVVSVYSFYDGQGSQMRSHFVRPLSLAATGQITGPLQVGTLGAGFYSGYMGTVPPEWQMALGGPALTGQADLSVISRTSYGPAAFAFDPSNLSSNGARPLVYYPQAHQTLGPWGAANRSFSGADTVRGVVFPNGTSTVLFFCRHGTTFCYGVGTADESMAARPSPNGLDPYCYDPTDGGKGVHGYPYEAYVWAYDANGLAAVHAGKKNPWDVTPYATWVLPGMGDTVGGAAYDPASGRVYVSEMLGAQGVTVHVYAISNGTSTEALAPSGQTQVAG